MKDSVMWPFRKKTFKHTGLAHFYNTDHIWANHKTIQDVIDHHFAFMGEYILIRDVSSWKNSDVDLIQIYYEDRRRNLLDSLKEKKKKGWGAEIRKGQMYLIFLREWHHIAKKKREEFRKIQKEKYEAKQNG